MIHEHSHDHQHAHTHDHRMPYARFSIRTLLILAVVMGLYYLLAPGVFLAEFAHPGKLILWTLGVGIPLSLFEYLYHRFLLHSAVLPFLGAMHDAHAEHHGLTSVKAPILKKEPEKMVPVKSDYPILHDHQEASMMFPWFAQPGFYAAFFLFFAWPLKAVFPAEPVISAMLICVTIYFAWYEIWHAILHLSFDDFWEPQFKNPRYGKLVEHVYSFHLMHHWRPVANLAVVGLWGFAVWDHVFRTHHRPKNTPIHESMVNYYDAQLPKPMWPISMMDKWQPAMYKFSRALERVVMKPFKKTA